MSSYISFNIYRVFFLTGPPPENVSRLAPPKSFKYENHIEVLRHLDFFRSWGEAVWDSDVFFKIGDLPANT